MKHYVNANVLYLCDVDHFLMSLYMYDGMLSIDPYQSLFQCVSVFQRKHPDDTFLPPRSNAELLYDIILFPGGRPCGLLSETRAVGLYSHFHVWWEVTASRL